LFVLHKMVRSHQLNGASDNGRWRQEEAFELKPILGVSAQVILNNAAVRAIGHGHNHVAKMKMVLFAGKATTDSDKKSILD
ncbi:hypothetical protein SLS63_010582, partial [Diaporthe eres]